MPVIWELDFYSRPVLDDNQKKLWEILICESPRWGEDSDRPPFRYAKYCKNTEVNSITVSAVLSEAIAQADTPPSKVRFFRPALKNAITAGCETVGVPAILSHRTYALRSWLAERLETVYPQEPGYDPSAVGSSLPMPPPAAQPLPDALLGQKWAFVTLEVEAFADLNEWPITFGEAFPLTGLPMPDGTKIPGLLIFSSRATAIAAWMSGLEMGFVSVEQQVKPSSMSSNRTDFPDQIVLETGIGDRWVFANLPDADLKTEGQNFEQAKQAAAGVHFLAVQQNPNEEQFAGFWLMRQVDEV